MAGELMVNIEKVKQKQKVSVLSLIENVLFCSLGTAVIADYKSSTLPFFARQFC